MWHSRRFFTYLSSTSWSLCFMVPVLVLAGFVVFLNSSWSWQPSPENFATPLKLPANVSVQTRSMSAGTDQQERKDNEVPLNTRSNSTSKEKKTNLEVVMKQGKDAEVPFSTTSSSTSKKKKTNLELVMKQGKDNEVPCSTASNSTSKKMNSDLRVVQEEEILNITTNDAQIYPSCNETHAIPLRARTNRRFNQLERLEAKMQKARTIIREAKYGNQSYDPDYIPSGPMYWNANSFHRSYLEMEKQFKLYVYEEGEPPIFHNGPCKSIYSMEGNFIYHMETTKFRTKDADRAHIFFLPISTTAIVHFIYDSKSKDHKRSLKKTVKDYVNLVARKYPYWNRSLGADHFILACHDWGPELSKSVPELYKNSIRCLCNANTSEGFNPSKDVSFPEVHLPGGTIDGLIGGPSPSERRILAFFAGALHGHIRSILLEHWEDKDEDVLVHRYLPKSVSYYGMMKKSKYCICPSGYEVASPRMVEALYTGCVPVIIKDHYVAPFSDVLNWKTFSVDIPVKDIPNLKRILAGISTRQYIRMQKRGRQVRRHFEVNFPPKRYDVFHMILHSVWLRRLNIRLHGDDS